MEKTTMKLLYPLNSSLVFICVGIGGSSLLDTLGFWKYIIFSIPIFIICWLLGNFKIYEKRVGIGIGILVVLSGLAIGLIVEEIFQY